MFDHLNKLFIDLLFFSISLCLNLHNKVLVFALGAGVGALFVSSYFYKNLFYLLVVNSF